MVGTRRNAQGVLASTGNSTRKTPTAWSHLILVHRGGAWSQFNIEKGGLAAQTVLERREAHRPILRLLDDIIADRVEKGRYVLCEHPARSEAWEQPEMRKTKDLLFSGKLWFVRADGCALGYKCPHTGCPYMKPMKFLTNLLSAETMLKDKKCSRDHGHIILQGPNCKQSAEWPEQLDRLVLDMIQQQIVIDEDIHGDNIEAFPVIRKHQQKDKKSVPVL